MPLACFLMACKFCETYAPRLADLVEIVGDGGCTVPQLRDAENSILASLRWDVESLTGETLIPFHLSAMQVLAPTLARVPIFPPPFGGLLAD